jgi:hypothetical protein
MESTPTERKHFRRVPGFVRLAKATEDATRASSVSAILTFSAKKQAL